VIFRQFIKKIIFISYADQKDEKKDIKMHQLKIAVQSN
jgi:hypothetical protein